MPIPTPDALREAGHNGTDEHLADPHVHLGIILGNLTDRTDPRLEASARFLVASLSELTARRDLDSIGATYAAAHGVTR